MTLELRIVHAQNDRYYVVCRMQHTYGSKDGFATREAAQAYIDEEDDDMTDLKDDTMIWWCENQQWATTIPDKGEGGLSSCGHCCGPMKFKYLPLWDQDQLRKHVAGLGAGEEKT